jgi:hypothetical protein
MRIAAGDREALSVFVHEVRRLYPFVPVLAAARAIVRTSSASPYHAKDWWCWTCTAPATTPPTGRIQTISTPAASSPGA